MSDVKDETANGEKKSKPPVSEQRASPRLDLKTEVSFQVSVPPPAPGTAATPSANPEAGKSVEAGVGFNSDTNFFAGFTEDVGDGGLFVATVDILPIGTKINLNFTLPTGQVVKSRGIVRWVRDPHFGSEGADNRPGMGIQFENLSEEDKKGIQGFMQNRDPLFYDE